MVRIELKGTITTNDDKWIYDWFGISAVCPQDIKTKLDEANGEDVTIEINSGGGDIFAGSEIAYMVSQYTGNIRADITGFCGSAATIISSSAQKVRAIPTAMFMIHNVSSGAQGDYHDMNKQSDVLQKANKSISNIYVQKTGLSEMDLLSLMDEETWMDMKEAKEKGFVDEIIGENDNKSFTINNSFGVNILSDEVKDRIRALKQNGELKNSESVEKAQKQINLLKLKGEF